MCIFFTKEPLFEHAKFNEWENLCNSVFKLSCLASSNILKMCKETHISLDDVLTVLSGCVQNGILIKSAVNDL